MSGRGEPERLNIGDLGPHVKIYVLCGLVLLLDGFETQAVAFVAPSVLRQWGLSAWQLGLLFSSTLLGSVAGSIVFGLLADRFGRRPLIIAATLIFGVASFACALSRGIEDLILFRLLGGIGMGGAIPNLNALTAEFAPRRLRTTIVTLTLWGIPLGAALGGLAAAPLIAHFGWRSVFWLGAAAPLLLIPPLILWLRESPRFSGAPAGKATVVAANPERASRGFWPLLLHPETLLLSGTTFLSLLLSYLLVNWIPTMLSQSGIAESGAILGTVALNLGGIAGSFALSRLMDRIGAPALLLTASFAVAASVLVATGTLIGDLLLVLPALFACGIFHIGSQITTASFAARTFPDDMRSTGLGVMHAIGRTGSLFGPAAGGILLSAGLTVSHLMYLAAIPAALCALLMLGFHGLLDHRRLAA